MLHTILSYFLLQSCNLFNRVRQSFAVVANLNEAPRLDVGGEQSRADGDGHRTVVSIPVAGETSAQSGESQNRLDLGVEQRHETRRDQKSKPRHQVLVICRRKSADDDFTPTNCLAKVLSKAVKKVR